MRSIIGLLVIVFFTYAQSAFAHCDSYDGPVIKDAYKAIEENNVNYVLKWISKEQEGEITELFNATVKLKGGNKEVYNLVEKHFLETLVRLHRETEGADYTGLKPGGTTKAIIVMSDESISEKDPQKLLAALNSHINSVIEEKYEHLRLLEKDKNLSPEKGREYVKAYVDYTHTIEGLHDIIEGKHSH